MRVKRLAHIGVAVRDAEKAARTFIDVLGLDDDGREVLEDRHLQTIFARAGDAHVELIQSLTDDTPIATYIARRGEGIHHVCLDVEGLDEMLERCREHGIQIVGDGASPGAQGKRVAFLHPKSTGGVLVELSEDSDSEAPGKGT